MGDEGCCTDLIRALEKAEARCIQTFDKWKWSSLKLKRIAEYQKSGLARFGVLKAHGT